MLVIIFLQKIFYFFRINFNYLNTWILRSRFVIIFSIKVELLLVVALCEVFSTFIFLHTWWNSITLRMMRHWEEIFDFVSCAQIVEIEIRGLCFDRHWAPFTWNSWLRLYNAIIILAIFLVHEHHIVYRKSLWPTFLPPIECSMFRLWSHFAH